MEIEIIYDGGAKDKKEIDKKIEQINKIVVEMASSYYIEKIKTGNNK